MALALDGLSLGEASTSWQELPRPWRVGYRGTVSVNSLAHALSRSLSLAPIEWWVEGE